MRGSRLCNSQEKWVHSGEFMVHMLMHVHAFVLIEVYLGRFIRVGR